MRWLAVVLFLMGVSYASLRSSPFMADVPGMPVGIGRWLDGLPFARHLIGYAVLAFLCGCALKRGKRFFAVGVGLLLLAAGLEGAQLFIPGRDANVNDFVYSAGGIAAGLGIAAGWRRFGAGKER